MPFACHALPPIVPTPLAIVPAFLVVIPAPLVVVIPAQAGTSVSA